MPADHHAARPGGQLEHDADIVMLLHRDRKESDTSCFIAKARDGRTGTVRLNFRSVNVAFEEIYNEDAD